MAITMESPVRQDRTRRGLDAVTEAIDRSRAFKTARRHTYLIRGLKFVLPVVAVGLLALYPLSMKHSFDLGNGKLTLGPVTIASDQLVMENPSYEGFDKAGNRFVVKAKSAKIEPSQKGPVSLSGIEALLTQPSNVQTTLTAVRGSYDQKSGELELIDKINIDATNGLVARLTRARVFTKEQRVVSEQPVEADMPTGRIRANAMLLNTKTRNVAFAGGVDVRLKPSLKANGGIESALIGASGAPIDVKSDTLDVDDQQKTALFRRNVRAQQGDTILTAAELDIRYEGRAALDGLGEPKKATEPSSAASEGAAQLRSLVARTGVVITVGTDRRIVAESAEFDAKTEKALLLGGVIATQGKSVIKGRRLQLDRKAGRTRLDSPADGIQGAGRIAALLQPDRESDKSAAKARESNGSGETTGLFAEFKTDPNAPVDIDADSLDADDTARTATFRGAVRASQGEFVVRAMEITAHYSGSAGLSGLSGGAASNAKTSTQITRIEARQKVIVTSKEGQTATGDWATFDMKANTVTLGGKVIVTQGKNVVEGDKLVIDMTTGQSRFENDRKRWQPVGSAPGVASAPITQKEGQTAATPAPPAAGQGPRECPPGRTCLMFYPKDADLTAKGASKPKVELRRKSQDGGADATGTSSWQSSTTAVTPGRKE